MTEEDNEIEIDSTGEGLDDSVVAEESQAEAIKKLREKLKAAEAKVQEYLDSWQRAQAEFVNQRKRDEEHLQEKQALAASRIIESMLPALDSLEIAVNHARGNNLEWVSDLEPVYSQIKSVLEKEGLEEVGREGDAFDPRLHEALKMEPTEDKSRDHHIALVIQKGFALYGKMVRPAKVSVYEYKGQ